MAENVFVFTEEVYFGSSLTVRFLQQLKQFLSVSMKIILFWQTDATKNKQKLVPHFYENIPVNKELR